MAITVAQQPRPLDPGASARELLGAQLRLLREAADLSQAQVGRHVYMSGAAVGTWEKGRSLPPGEDTVGKLDAFLDGRGLLLAAYELAIRTHADSHADKPPTGQRRIAEPDIIRFVPEPSDEIDQAARDAADFGAWTEKIGTGSVALEVIHQQVRNIATDALSKPPTEIIARTAPLARHVYGLARQHQRPAHARELHLLAARLCSIMAWISGDLGRLDQAGFHAATAIACAENAGDPETTAWAYAVASKTSFWRRDYAAAADHAARGASFDPPGTVAVMLACQRADTYSKQGDASRTRRALVSAVQAAEFQGPDAVGGLLSCGPVRHANYASSSLLAIGEAGSALAQADQALAAAADEQLGFGTVAQIHLTRALAHAAVGEIDGAGEAARPVLDLPSDRRLATLTGRIASLGRELERPHLKSAAAAELAEEIRVFCATSPSTPELPPAPQEDL